MLEYKNNKLEYSGEKITENNTIVTLVVDQEYDNCSILGQLTLPDGSNILYPFTYFGDCIYKVKLFLNETIQKLLKKSYFNIIFINDSNVKKSNLIQFNFDYEKIDFSLKKNKANDIEELYTKIAQLEKTINHLVKGHALTSIVVNNKDYIKKGMVLQAVDDEGNFIATYPFNDMIKDINGFKAVNNSIILDTSMIKYNKELNLEDKLNNISNAVIEIGNALKANSNAILQLQTELTELKLKVEKHINDGIV